MSLDWVFDLREKIATAADAKENLSEMLFRREQPLEVLVRAIERSFESTQLRRRVIDERGLLKRCSLTYSPKMAAVH